MTQEGLTTWFTGRGWEVKSLLEEHHKLVGAYDGALEDMRKGISMWCISPTGYTLSIQAGFGLYSEPRAYADMYTSVEIALWKDRGGGRKDKGDTYIRDVIITSGEDVKGWTDFEEIVAAVHEIEDWKDGRGPRSVISRSDTPWAMEE
jgi:hypothetical protein